MEGAFTAPAPSLLARRSHLGLLSLRANGLRLPPSVARRRRVITADGSGGVDGGPKDGEKTEPRKRDPDTDASDLALPDLKALFEPSGDPDCEQCEGAGLIVCPVCQGKGYITMTMMDTTSSTQCRMCKGKRFIPCPSCRAEVYKSVLWWDLIPSVEDDPEEKWREGPDGKPRIRWSDNPAGPGAV